MREKELFDEILNCFIEQYRLEIKYPYNDGYMEIRKDDKFLGSFNRDGYNLLFNLSRLCDVLNGELR